MPILARDGSDTVLFVSCKRKPGPELRSALRALCSQIAHAIEVASPSDNLNAPEHASADQSSAAA